MKQQKQKKKIKTANITHIEFVVVKVEVLWCEGGGGSLFEGEVN